MSSAGASDLRATALTGRARRRLARRHRAEKRFRAYGFGAIAIALGILMLLFASIVIGGWGAFFRSEATLEIRFDAERIDPDGLRKPDVLATGDYGGLVRDALERLFPDVAGRRAKRALRRLMSRGAAYDLQKRVLDNPALIGQSASIPLPLSDEADLYVKGRISPDLPETERTLSDRQIAWLDALRERGRIHTGFNPGFFSSGDSREPELAGIGGALVGSLMTLFVALILCFPLGVAAAVYLEELAPETRWTRLVEVNINNLAAVPSVIFGVLGLAIFLGTFGLPRSAPLVGGLVLSLRTLPIIIIASRASLAAVPPSIRSAAMAIGASPIQVVAHHVVPNALPGILTGTIIGMAQALGETAPLLMIGMVAFVVDIPTGITDPATVLPVQIYLWADSPERAFVEKTAGAIIVLLAFLVSMNGTAVWLRQRFEKRT
ncbi:MAG TPA: phosphate ABC transporter permease PstA [Deltaproteobacteria bacterium]|nr:phosphate ABC transporter permease PstA [Deltaproteobacteria bacterium]